MRLAFLFLLGFFITVAKAQNSIPAFGKITVDDLNTNACSFEPGAGACKLIDWGNLFYNRDIENIASFQTIFERRIRIKILKQSALEYANITIPFYSGNSTEKIIRVEAYTYNLVTGNKVKRTRVDKKAIYIKQINKQRSEVTIVFPELKVGSVIEYRYTLQSKAVTEIKDWYFQSDIPVRYSSLQVSIPLLFHFNMQPFTTDSIEIKENVYNDNSPSKTGIIITTTLKKSFTMHNLHSIQSEPYMGAAKDYLQRVVFQLADIDYGNGSVVNISSDWEDVVQTLKKDEDFGAWLNRKVVMPTDLKAALDTTEAMRSRMILVYNYVKKQLRWNNIESVYSFQGFKKSLKNKSGSSGDINLLLIALLNGAGIQGSPVLFSTRQNGLLNTTLPFVKQFNTVMALVEDKDANYILDGTDHYGNYHLVPEQIVNTKGFVVEGEEGRWLQAMDTNHTYNVVTAVSGEINTDKKMSGNAFISYSGYARKPFCEAWISDKEQITTGYINENKGSFQIDEIAADNMETDSLPAGLNIKFSMIVNKGGDHYSFTPYILSALPGDIATAAVRRTDIDFGYRQQYSFYGKYSIPPNCVFEQVPENLSLLMPDTSIALKRFVNVEKNIFNFKITIDYNHTWYPASSYPVFAAFNKLILSKLNEQVIFKTKD